MQNTRPHSRFLKPVGSGGGSMKSISLFDLGIYSTAWIRDFYTQTGEWWGADPQAPGVHETRVETLERLCGPGSKTVLDLGAGPGATAAGRCRSQRHCGGAQPEPRKFRPRTRKESAKRIPDCPGGRFLCHGTRSTF